MSGNAQENVKMMQDFAARTKLDPKEFNTTATQNVLARLIQEKAH
jgi:hypothetical protein